jgi:hypothetical protein
MGIQCQCRIISGLWQFKKLNVDGMGNRASTQMRTLYNWFNLRTQWCTSQYHAVCDALVALDPNRPWQSRLQELCHDPPHNRDDTQESEKT